MTRLFLLTALFGLALSAAPETGDARPPLLRTAAWPAEPLPAEPLPDPVPVVAVADGERPARRGTASRYARRFEGRRTANGERYDHAALTTAHRTLPFGTLVRVTNERNGQAVVVRVNDRGPFVRGRVLDLSGAAARRIGFYSAGLTSVRYEIVEPDALPSRRPTPARKTRHV